MANHAKATPQKKGKFLAIVQRTGNVSKAVEAIGIHRNTAYEWRILDPDFALAWDNARKSYVDLMEAEADRRAMGWDEQRYTADGMPYTIRKYSDTLLIFRLKGESPEKYKERITAEHSGPGGGPIEQAVVFSFEHRLERTHTELEVLRNGHSR